MTDIFDDNQSTDQTTQVVTPPASIQLPDQVAALVGEGKKYATVEKALEALPHAQQHISTLETELKALKEQVAQGRAVEEVYETVQDLLKQNGKTPAPVEVSEDAIAGVLDRQLKKREAEQKAQQNVATFKEAFEKKYGEKAKEQWAAKAAEMGVSPEFLSDVVRKSAAAGLKLFDLSPGTAGAPRSTQGSVNTAALQAQIQQPDKPKPVMFGAKTSDVVAAWRAAAPKTD